MKSKQDVLRLLSFDGGGIRGLSGLFMLHEMMNRIEFDQGLDDTPKPCDYFDMIGGGGTGGLNAILVGRLGLVTQEAIHNYLKIMETAFPKQIVSQERRVDNIKKCVEGLLAEMGLAPNARMLDKDDLAGKCKVVIYVVPIYNMQRLHPLRSYKGRSHALPNVTIVEAILVSLASPNDLGSISLGEGYEKAFYVNTGLSGHNPSQLLLREAEEVFKRSADIVHVGSIISFGSGKPTTSMPFPSFLSVPATSTSSSPTAPAPTTPDQILQILEQLWLSGESVHEDLQHRTQNFRIYFRFNVEQEVGSIPINDWELAGQVKALTQTFLQEGHISQKLDQAAELICNQATKVAINLINAPGIPETEPEKPPQKICDRCSESPATLILHHCKHIVCDECGDNGHVTICPVKSCEGIVIKSRPIGMTESEEMKMMKDASWIKDSTGLSLYDRLEMLKAARKRNPQEVISFHIL